MNSSNIWQLQNAKNKLSELINIASEGKPQLITKNGKPSVYVVKADDINLYSNTESLKKVILGCPYKGFDIPRDKDYGRDIVL
ncbi:MAG: type II toxin-antitoxin system Phd/YefM family antitoxin [Spirochaetales bacterium]|nr:type II toxin-antitoxin system Phd/YefM family antitoxin [Spirochaetales bacterium]